jgi:hypothetical protein
VRLGFRARLAAVDHWLVYSAAALVQVQAAAVDHWLVYSAGPAALVQKEFGRLRSRGPCNRARKAAWAPSSAA